MNTAVTTSLLYQRITNENMNLEEQVCSLDLAKRLKKLGVKQESYFRWCVEVFSGDSFEHNKTHPELHVPLNDQQITKNKAMIPICSAFTVAELAHLLLDVAKHDIFVALPDITADNLATLLIKEYEESKV